MERCAVCKQDVLMSHPLDRCVRCNEPTCPECVFTHVVVCKTCVTSKTPFPRVPTVQEKEQLAERIKHLCSNYDEARQMVESNAYIAVFGDYMTDSPGYAGKVMFVLWSDKPSHYELWTFGNDNYPPLVLQETEKSVMRGPWCK